MYLVQLRTAGTGHLVERWAEATLYLSRVGQRAPGALSRFEQNALLALLSCGEASKVRPWASLLKEVMPMVQLLRAVLANTVGRLLADLIRRLLD